MTFAGSGARDTNSAHVTFAGCRILRMARSGKGLEAFECSPNIGGRPCLLRILGGTKTSSSVHSRWYLLAINLRATGEEQSTTGDIQP